jgi:two-component system osmolarity sensor histidine kinase EnvZ
MKQPPSLLLRLFLSMALLALASHGVWLGINRYTHAEPRAWALAQFCASAVNLVRAAILSAEPALRPALLQQISDEEGIRLLPREETDVVEPLPDDRFWQIVLATTGHIDASMPTMSLSVNGQPGLWVSFRLSPHDTDEFWLVLPAARVKGSASAPILGWIALSTLCALFLSWLLASRMARPLRSMAKAARDFGRGVYQPLPENGCAPEIQELSHAFNRMAEDLFAQDDEQAEILAGISHDLRTPLARIRLEAEMSADPEAREAMIADVAQMDAIIAQFLDYARRREEADTPTDLAAFLSEFAARQQAVGRPVALDLPDAGLPLLKIRPKMLTRALANLADNAWKYGKPPIRLRAGWQGGWLSLGMVDQGQGVEAEEFERLKRPFIRGEAARSNAQGAGLGLAIVARIAQSCGGSFECGKSPEGFEIRLTVKAEEA